MYKRLILLLALISLSLLGLSGAQLELKEIYIPGGMTSPLITGIKNNEGIFSTDILSSGEEFLVTEIATLVGENGQIMTPLDSGGIMASEAIMGGTDSSWLAWPISQNISSGQASGETNSEINLQIYTDPNPSLILSEIYFDGTDEWIEISNISSTNFSGILIFSGIATSPISLGLHITGGTSTVLGRTNQNFSTLLDQGYIQNYLSMSFTDTKQINVSVWSENILIDSFLVETGIITSINDKKTSCEKILSGGIWMIVPTPIQRTWNIITGYQANPGKWYESETSPPTTGVLPPSIEAPFILNITEVYFDGTDEWIEISNIGSGNFQGNITLSGVKSTPVSMENISLVAGESKIFGDELKQISGNSFIGKTGISLNLIDTATISIQAIISGQIVDSFFVNSYRVHVYNDKKTSFERIGEIITPVQMERSANAQSGYIINPGIYVRTGTNIINVVYPPSLSGVNLDLPLSCDSVDQRDLIKITEIFPGNEKYPPYIELAIHEDITLDRLSLSGDLLGTGIVFLWNTGGMNLQKNSFLLISATGYREDEKLPSLEHRDFSLLSTGNRLLITLGSGQNGQVIDIVYRSGNILGSSLYFADTSYQCVKIFDALDDFSPGFEQKFLKYFGGSTVTKIEYVQIGTGNQTTTGTCQSPGVNTPLSGDMQISTDISSIINDYRIRILDIEYDPSGSDTNNEKITLLATSISANPAPLDLSKIFRLKVNGTNKTLPWILPMDTPTTFTKTFGFPNSTTSGQDVIVTLSYEDHIYDTYIYNPKKLSSQEEKELTTTGYTVSSVLDGDTLRIKYQGKTQSVRLLGIDAPESNKTRYKHLECFGTEAKNYLKLLVDKKKITFQFDPSQDEKDIYDRLLAYVFLDGELINQTMIEEGYAKEYTYKTSYRYQSTFKQAEQSAQEQLFGLWNEKTCGVSLSGLVLTGDEETTGTVLSLSGLTFAITYVLPNPKGSDKFEELGLVISRDEGKGTNVTLNEMKGIVELLDSSTALRMTGNKNGFPIRSGMTSNYLIEPEMTGIQNGFEMTGNKNGFPIKSGMTGMTGMIDTLDLSQGFSLRVVKSTKKLNGIVNIGQENILSGSLGLVNKAACVALFYEEQELTKFCYGKPKEGQKIFASDTGMEETLQENLDILNTLQLKRRGNQLCIRYKEQFFLCKRIPASKAEIKVTQEQKLYKGFVSLMKQYMINNWKTLYYDTPLKTYFDRLNINKQLIASGVGTVDIYGQKILVTDTKKQIDVLENTLPGIIAIFRGIEALLGERE